ncbi:LysR substrate-binding domain-containing protein [Serratia sp. M24T3]|uniref:LysR substrate-binding domain-containing protein n=1 Tax=Serratia sp. M24T3 TaxID=932213 RepID=UPI00025BAA72|nr:LysR substrate-binding domain-containing protein [Serratia sp. M24T3]EIC86181.1 LysR family transcriptional regulator [Serratia sp. M24T3]
MHSLPPLAALKAFFVACHAGSYTAAARELYITHGAVSRHIQVVEKWFGVNLFIKQGQRRVPTPYALTLARELGGAFDTLSDIALRYGNGGRNNVFNVSVPTTLSLKWLLPRLDDFYARFPDANLQISTANTEQLHNIGHYDLLIRRETSSTEYSAIPFLQDHHCLMASPALLKRYAIERPLDIFSCPRIETLTRPGQWNLWLKAAGLDKSAGNGIRRYDHFHVSLHAMLEGIGVGLGPINTLSQEIARGNLQPLFAKITVAPNQYYALTPVGVQKTLLHRAFEDWLVSQGQRDIKLADLPL